MTIPVLCVPYLTRPDMAPLQAVSPAVMVTIGKFGLTRVTGLRPTLLVVQVLVRRQSILPSPSVFLQETVVFTLWFMNSVDRVLPYSRVVLRMVLARALKTYRTRLVALESLWNSTCVRPAARWHPIRVSSKVSSARSIIRLTKSPAEVIVTLPPVPAQTMLLSLCVMGSFIMPATLKIPVFPTCVL